MGLTALYRKYISCVREGITIISYTAGWVPPMYFQRHPKQGLTYWLNKGSNHALRHTYTSFKTLLSPRNKGCLWSQRVNIYERDGVSNNNYT